MARVLLTPTPTLTLDLTLTLFPALARTLALALTRWREYFPLAHFWIVDIDVTRFADEPLFKWSTRQKRRHGCFDSATAHDTWHDAQVDHSK